MRNKKGRIGLFLIVVIISFLYGRTLDFGFVWLDHSQIEEGKCIIKNFPQLRDAFIRPLLVSEGKGNYYRPIFKISYTLDYLIYGLSPRGFRFTNLIIHLFNLILLYSILIYLKIEKKAALLICFLYGIIPINVSPVVCLIARADILSASFILLSFLLFLKFENENKSEWYLLSLLGYFLALLTKEIAIGLLPVMIIWIYLKKNPKKYIGGYLIITIFYLLGRFFILGRLGTRIPLLWGDPYPTLLSSCVGFLKYFLKTFLPYNLSISDAFPRYDSIFHPVVLIALGFMGIFIVFLWKYLSSREIIPSLALVWILSFYLPVSNIVPALHFWAERFFYIPGIGLMIFLAYILHKNSGMRKLTIFILPIYILANINYQKYFRDDFVLFQRALKVSEFSQEAHTMLGYLYMQRKDYPRAVYHYTFALQEVPYYYTYVNKTEILNNLGVIFMRLKEYSKARSYFLQGLKISPRDSTLLLNLSILNEIESR
jgi:tetratricopeptide (TPR) repeat protein